MTQLGGHGIYYNTVNSPLGVKESIEDTAKVLSRYCDAIIARVMTKSQIDGLADNSTIPVINALDDWGHPCQILADALTITEKRGSLEGLKMAFVGDLYNNVTYDIMRMAAIVGFELRIAGPDEAEYQPDPVVVKECEELGKASGGKVVIVKTAIEAVKDVDVVYADSWMSYGVSSELKEKRLKAFNPFKITEEVMEHTKPTGIFMNCLPADRTQEQTAGVIDGPKSVVFDQAENRLHMQKAILLWLIGVDKKYFNQNNDSKK